jgi:hypothetical protein
MIETQVLGLIVEILMQYELIQELKFQERLNKSKAVPLHAMQAYWGRGGTAPTHS